MNSQTFQKPHNLYLCDISFKRVTYMPEALIRNVTFPAVQNFLHIYAEQDLRARNTVREPSELNKMSDSDEIVCWASILELGADVLGQVNVDVQLEWSLPDRWKKDGNQGHNLSFIDHNQNISFAKHALTR